MRDVQTFPHKEALIQGAVTHILELAQNAIEARGRFVIALSGGSTPRPVYEQLAGADTDWSKWVIVWGDERCVPPDDEASNYRMTKDAWLDKVTIPMEQIYRMQGEIDPIESAKAYEKALWHFGNGQLPRIDLTLMGMGDDGHTASLFPYSETIHEQHRWVVGQHVEKLDACRLTLTPVVFNRARQVTFLVSGANKADTLKQVLEGDYQPNNLPSQVIQPLSGKVSWFIDAEAGSQLS